MELGRISASVKVALCVCALDGLISESEEAMIFQLVSEKFSEYRIDDFNAVIEEFFDSKDQIEDYLQAVIDPEMRNFTLYLAEASASIDGLDIRENIALQKAFLIWDGAAHE